MKLTNGKILLYSGVAHFLLGISPFAFGKQYHDFSNKLFFKISEGLSEFHLLDGHMNYENFAAFWFVYFGLLLIPMAFLVEYIEKTIKNIPNKFIWIFNYNLDWNIYDSIFWDDFYYATSCNLYDNSKKTNT